ncbi:SCP-like protein [Ancylostoma caninum]|uniref:SCP-like protein n=1 Tax=Ancylostoma caninum TaxID=29170 RepID=A0A368GF80_ANCCA|nr:SCP-like protein [Ancylostoma caninum]
MCSSFAYANRMTNALRNEYVRLHNFRRGLLAKGEIPRKDGKLLPRAANMWSMSYDCALEDGAIKWASRCPTSLSEPSSRPNVGENFKTFPATRFNYDTAAKKSVTEWWKVIRSVNYFEKVAVFRPFHEGAPISSFTQMGWAMSNKLGCSIVKCRTSNVYVGVCRYSPRGNMVNHNIYEVGAPCSRNPGGASSCNSAEGLWF